VSHQVTPTGTLPLFPDASRDRKVALEADIAAAGGQQLVGCALNLGADPIQAGKMVSNKINRNGNHRFSADEVWQIKELARKAAGVSRLHELESDGLQFEGKWLTCEDIKARKRARKAALLKELLALENDE
jgi:hypothetical protein